MKISPRFIVLFLSLIFLTGVECESQIIEQIDSLENIRPDVIKVGEPRGDVFVIRIRNQKQFEDINESITSAIELGETNISVVIENGVYYFHEKHILRKGERHNDVSIRIIGRNAVLTSSTNFLSVELGDNGWQDLLPSDGLIEIIDKDKGICKIPYKNNISEKEKIHITRVQITQWYRAPSYNISDIDNTGIYFNASDLKYIDYSGHKEYNVNYDYLYAQRNPRFRLFDITKYQRRDASCFINLNDCAYRYFGISGIRFSCNKEEAALIELRNVKTESVNICNNSFEYIRGNVCLVVNTDNVLFDGNHVRDTEGHELKFVRGCKHIQVTNNVFENCGKRLGQTFCINCGEAEYYIAENIFRDFGYCAIGVGIWHGNEKELTSKGIIEHNEIYYTSQYLADLLKHTLMDSGAIYVWTQNDGVIIKYNYIHDYGGPRSNTAIFCDDGASNCKIYKNIITNISTKNVISARKVEDQRINIINNSNNFIAYNIVDGSILFMGYGIEERHCIKGENIVLNNSKREPVMNILANLEYSTDDIVIENWNESNGKLYIPRSYKRTIKRKFTDRFTRHFIRYVREIKHV